MRQRYSRDSKITVFCKEFNFPSQRLLRKKTSILHIGRTEMLQRLVELASVYKCSIEIDFDENARK